MLIKEAMASILKNDTLQLFKIIDTAYCFSIYSKEGFLFKARLVYDKLNGKLADIDTTRLKIENQPMYQTKYTFSILDFVDTSYIRFNLIFRFAAYNPEPVIDFWDIDIFRHPQPIEPLLR